MKYFFEEFQRMIRTRSVTLDGNEELANYILGLLQDRGLKAYLQSVAHSDEDLSRKQFNVVGILGDSLVDRKTKKGLLLHTHLDTPSPGLFSEWGENGGDPWALVFRSKKCYGLGVADAKLDFLAKLKAIEKFRERKLKQPLYWVGSCCQKMGMQGVRYLIQSQALNPRYVLVGEPTGLQLVYAHKSCCLFQVTLKYQQTEKDPRGFHHRVDLTAFGRRTHGAYPQLGKNAIVALLDFLQEGSEKNQIPFRLAVLGGGNGMRQVPDRATAQFYLDSEGLPLFQSYLSTKMGLTEEFEVEYGGVGDMGIRFLPTSIFPCLSTILNYFRSIESGFQGKQGEKQNEAYFPSSSTFNLNRILQKTGSIQLVFDFRLLPESSIPNLFEQIQESMKQIVSHYPYLNIHFSEVQITPPFQTSLEEDWVRTVREVMVDSDIAPHFFKSSVSTEAAWYAKAGFPTLVFGPGDPIVEGRPLESENLSLDQWEKAVVFYENLIEKICL